MYPMVTNRLLQVNSEKTLFTSALRLCYLPPFVAVKPLPYTSLRMHSGAFVQEDRCMELYESLFIIRPSVSDEETNALIEKMKGIAERTGAQFIKSENWGRKKLAYEVRRERKGTYVYFYFKAPNNTVGELEHAYRLEDNIIKFLTVHLEKELVPRRVAEAPSEEFTGGRV